MIHIGIDTGVTTGFAVSEKQKLTRVESMGIIEAQQEVLKLCEQGDVMLHIEDARMRKWYGNDQKKSAAKRQGAGSIKRDASVWEEFCVYHGIPCRMVNPMNNTTKLDAKAFKRMTGWQGRTNEHGRDAAMLVVGM